MGKLSEEIKKKLSKQTHRIGKPTQYKINRPGFKPEERRRRISFKDRLTEDRKTRLRRMLK